MALKIISDVHGEYGALSGQLSPSDTAILLGDYLNLIDFHTLEGILAEVYTREEIIQALAALAGGRRELSRRSIREISGADKEKYRRVRELMIEGYEELFAALPCRSIMIYGNTDDPRLMRELAGESVELIEAGVLEIAGRRFGFVSGCPRGPWAVGLPGEKDPEEYGRMVDSLGPVEVLCTHCPPSIPELTWDELADRDEVGSRALLSYLERFGPTHHYFGHVHNPRVDSVSLGPTKVINAGFFKRHRTALAHEP